MPPRPALSKSEMLVVRTIWQLGQASVGQVYDSLSQHVDMDYTTVQTYIRRLEQKEYIRAKRTGRNKVYSAKVQPGKVIKETVDDFMHLLFDGEMIPLMRHLIHDREIQPEQIQELREMLRDVEAQQHATDDE